MKSKPCQFSTISRTKKLYSDQKSWNVTWKICVWKILALRNSRFCAKTSFCFKMKKHLLKEMNYFWCRDHDYALIPVDLSENFHTRMVLNFYFKTVPPPPSKTSNFASNCHFVSSWKCIYWNKSVVFDDTIRILRQLLLNYARNIT